MTYNLSPKSVERMQRVLDELLPGKERRLSTDEPHKLSYRIREALAAAKKNGISPYDRIDFTFTIGHGFVQATPNLPLVKKIESPAQIEDTAKTEFDVVAIADRSAANEIQFPAFSGKVSAVKQWARKAGWSVTTDPLTLTRS